MDAIYDGIPLPTRHPSHMHQIVSRLEGADMIEGVDVIEGTDVTEGGDVTEGIDVTEGTG